VKVRQVAEDLGVRYVLEGSVQRAGDQVRINAQLIDAITGGHLWARRYDRNWEDIFSLQDDITQHIVANIISFEGPLEEALRKRIEQKRPSDLRAYDYLLLGRNRFFLVAKEDNIIARGLFQKSLEIEPSYSKGHTWMAWTHLVDFTFGWTDDPVKSSQSSLGHAQKAVVLDNSDPEAHWVLGAISIQSGQQPQKGLAAYQKAISLSPNNADLLAEYGWAIPKVGKSDEAIISIKKAMRLNPIYPDWYSQALIFALYTAKRYEEVIKASEEFNIRHLHTYLELAGSFAKLGRKDEARKAAANALKLNPDFSLSWWRERINFSNTDALEHYMDGLRKTGLPD
jgi:adenylate cyclase